MMKPRAYLVRSRWSRSILVAAGALCFAGLMSGCVQVNAPNRPIEITLNINIRQEVVYRINDDARELIEQNAEVF